MRDHFRVRHRPGAHREVDALADDVDDALVEAQVEVDARIARQEIGQRGQQDVAAERAGHVHAQPPGRLFLAAAQRFLGRGELREHAPAMPEVVGAGGRHRDLAGRAVEQAQAKPLLEPLHMRADHGPRKAEFVGRAREGAELGNPAESLHGLEIFHAAIR